MAIQSLPSSARRYIADQEAEFKRALRAIQRQWSRMGSQFDGSYSSIEPTVLAIMATAQTRIAEGAAEYVPEVLVDLGQSNDLEAEPVPLSLVGVAGDGRQVSGLLLWSVTVAKQSIAEGLTVPQALDRGGLFLDRAARTVFSDTARAAEAVTSYVSPARGYTRMVVGGTCSRCVVLAGRFYRWNAGFQRHPGCDCRHIPTAESVAGDLMVDPNAYFDSLSPEVQARVFTVAGAKAIREGADISQVVNARRGMTTAASASGRRRMVTNNVFGRDIYTTMEGTTRRGYGYHALSKAKNANPATDVKRGRYRATVAPRLMPETIFEIAENRADAMRLLKLNGYIL